MDDPVIKHLHSEITKHLVRIEKLFVPGYRLTLVGRNPQKPNQDICLSGEDPKGNPEDQCKAIKEIVQNFFDKAMQQHRLGKLTG